MAVASRAADASRLAFADAARNSNQTRRRHEASVVELLRDAVRRAVPYVSRMMAFMLLRRDERVLGAGKLLQVQVPPQRHASPQLA